MNDVQKFILNRAMQKVANGMIEVAGLVPPIETIATREAMEAMEAKMPDTIKGITDVRSAFNSLLGRRGFAQAHTPKDNIESPRGEYTPMTPEQRAKLENDLAYEQGRGAVLRTGLGVMNSVLAPRDAVNWGVNKVKGIANSPAVQGGIQGVKDLAEAVIPAPSRSGLIERLKYPLGTPAKVKAKQTK